MKKAFIIRTTPTSVIYVTGFSAQHQIVQVGQRSDARKYLTRAAAQRFIDQRAGCGYGLNMTATIEEIAVEGWNVILNGRLPAFRTYSTFAEAAQFISAETGETLDSIKQNFDAGCPTSIGNSDFDIEEVS